MKSKNIFVKRQRALQEALDSLGVDCYLCDQTVDIFYLTGMKLSLGRLLVHSRSIILFVDARYLAAAQKKAHCSVKKISNEQLLHIFSSAHWKEVRSIGFDTQTPFARVEAFKAFLKTAQKKRCLKKPYHMKGLEAPIQKMRGIKDASELRLIRNSAALLWKGFLHAKKQLVVGIEERQVALAFEFYCRKQGAEELSFSPIIAFGSHTALPHYHTGKKRLKKGDIVLMDLGVRLDGYASDMTRTFFFGSGKPELQKLYRVVEQAKKTALKLCQAGVAISEMDRAARNVMKDAGLEKHFLHSLGHGIGLDVHESPNFRGKEEVLKQGMVITIEPGLYLPGKGGVRLEDMVIVTKTGHQNLFKSS